MVYFLIHSQVTNHLSPQATSIKFTSFTYSACCSLFTRSPFDSSYNSQVGHFSQSHQHLMASATSCTHAWVVTTLCPTISILILNNMLLSSVALLKLGSKLINVTSAHVKLAIIPPVSLLDFPLHCIVQITKD